MMKFNFYKYFSPQMLKNFLLFAFVLVISACDGEDGMSRGTEENYNKQSECWQTYIISAVLKIIDQLFNKGSEIVYDGSAGSKVILIGFAVWMGFKFLKILPSFKAENLGETLTEIGQKLFLCAFCAWAVNSRQEIVWTIDTFVVPIYNTILGLASNVINVEPSVQFNLGEIGSATFSNQYNNCEGGLTSVGGTIKGAINPMANCIVCSISSRLNAGVKIGIELIASLDIAAMVLGLCLIVFFLMAKFGFVLFIIDSLFRLNFAIYLLPIMIVAIPFAYTRKWATHCILMFLNSSGIMLFIGLLISLSVNALEIIMISIGPELNGGQLQTPGPILMAMFMISLLLFNIPGLGVSLADKFIGGGGGDSFSKKVSKFIVNLAKKAGAAAFAYLTAGASSAITTPLEKYEYTREKLDNIRQLNNKVRDKINSVLGQNDD